MGLGTTVKQLWERAAGVEAAAGDAGERKTVATPLGLSPVFAPFRGTGVQNVMKGLAGAFGALLTFVHLVIAYVTERHH